MNKDHPKFAVHKSHCWQNEYVNSCKYADDVCPAEPDVWPHPTYDESGTNVWVTRTGKVVRRPGRAWGQDKDTKYVYYVHKDNPSGKVFKDDKAYIDARCGGKIPEWAIEIDYNEEDELTFTQK